MWSNKLPSILGAPNTADSLSMERALKQIKFLLEQVPYYDIPGREDEIQASIDAIETMLNAIDRG